MFMIAYFNRNTGKSVKKLYSDMETAKRVANEIFRQTGIVVGIEEI